ncbi:hypothetical protein OIU79_029294 [Salix purpurea]|uniref:Uncharacterized protein n=1 Tax=Salix purpurea TaxID=77065 RepID=A0A9Q0ZVJ8_SALPP|nr:hypothetical protein OIU79_029294 [Salix purpurea]
MKTIQWIKVKFRKVRDNKVDELEQRRFHQVLAETNSLKDQLSEANRKIAELENMARAFQAQESLNHQLSNGKKEEDDGKLEDELAKKAEENQRLKSQLDRKGKEFAKLRNNIRSACMFTVKSPPENGNDYSYDLLGAMPSAGDDMWLKYLSDGDDK